MKKILVHICCSVDSHYFLQKMQKDYPDAKLIGFFYDPNIHPYSEYYLRLLDVKRSCKRLGIELIEGEYDYEAWIEATRGLEDEPEKGKRCSVCFDRRFEVSAKKASELGCSFFTSTLLTSPKKSLKLLQQSGDALAKKYGIEFLAPDYRSKSGTQEQNILAKQDKLYRQNYCGCLYALKQQREQQDRLLDELFCPASGQILPNSIEYRVALYEQRVKLEEQGIKYDIVKNRILNYRLLFAKVMHKKQTIFSYIVPFSKLRNSFSRGKVEKEIDGVFYFNRDEIKFINLAKYNALMQTKYKSVLELSMNPPFFEDEVALRGKLGLSVFDLSAVIVLDRVEFAKYEIVIDAKIYEDVAEKIVLLK